MPNFLLFFLMDDINTSIVTATQNRYYEQLLCWDKDDMLFER